MHEYLTNWKHLTQIHFNQDRMWDEKWQFMPYRIFQMFYIEASKNKSFKTQCLCKFGVLQNDLSAAPIS